MTFLRKALQRPSTAAYVAFATLSTPAFAQDVLHLAPGGGIGGVVGKHARQGQGRHGGSFAR